jgi:hypothetical protein
LSDRRAKAKRSEASGANKTNLALRFQNRFGAFYNTQTIFSRCVSRSFPRSFRSALRGAGKLRFAILSAIATARFDAQAI